METTSVWDGWVRAHLLKYKKKIMKDFNIYLFFIFSVFYTKIKAVGGISEHDKPI